MDGLVDVRDISPRGYGIFRNFPTLLVLVVHLSDGCSIYKNLASFVPMCGCCIEVRFQAKEVLHHQC